jgi:hypothetical protein
MSPHFSLVVKFHPTKSLILLARRANFAIRPAPQRLNSSAPRLASFKAPVRILPNSTPHHGSRLGPTQSGRRHCSITKKRSSVHLPASTLKFRFDIRFTVRDSLRAAAQQNSQSQFQFSENYACIAREEIMLLRFHRLLCSRPRREVERLNNFRPRDDNTERANENTNYAQNFINNSS